MIVIPLQAIPAQTVNVQLNGQSVTVNVYKKFYQLMIDVLVNDVLIIGGVSCLNLNRIVRSKYLGFIGDLAFFDAQDKTDPDDPDWPGLGIQFFLIYFFPNEVDSLVEAANEAALQS